MNTELSELKKTLEELKENQKIVEIEPLLKYINEINSSKNISTKNDFLLSEYKAQTDINIANANNENAMEMEMYKSVVSSGQSAIKISMIINGGGAVSLLAFISKIWASGLNKEIIEYLSLSILFFSIGILFTAVTSGTTYLTQHSYALKKEKLGDFINFISIALIIFSYLTFFTAIFYSLKSFGFDLF